MTITLADRIAAREVVSHALEAIGGGFGGFPLTYHWRVLSGKLPSGAGIDGFADIDEAVAYWDGSAAVTRTSTIF